MFDDVKKNDVNINNQAPQVVSPPDDMFGGLEAPVAIDKPSAVVAAKLQAKQNVNLPPVPVAANVANAILIEDEHSQGAVIKKVFVALSGLLLLALVIWGAYYFLILKKNSEKPEPNNNNNNQVNTQTTNNNNNTETEIALDTDGDGLSDAEEKALNIDPTMPDTDEDGLSDKDELRIHNTSAVNPDTDNDGLSDKDEIFKYQTNALDPDTDNDTYLDGVEVNNGYNPNGDGLLVK